MGSPCKKHLDPAFKLFGTVIPVFPSISDPALLQDAREGNGNPINYSNEERGLHDGANENGRGEKVGVEGATNAIVFRKVEESIAKKMRFDRVFACPRCDSTETKFCYYNNYNMNQPRHFCKKCQRYWTAGGTLRNVPIGSGRRRNKTQSQSQNQLQNHSQAATSIDAGGPSRRDMSDIAYLSSSLAVSSTGPKKRLPPLAGPPMHMLPLRCGVSPLHRYRYVESHAGVSEVSEMFMEESSTCGSSLTAQQDIMKEKEAVDSELKLVDTASQGKTMPDASIGQHQFRWGTIAWNQVNGELQTNMPWNNHVKVPMWWQPNLGCGGATSVPNTVESDVHTPVLRKHPDEDPTFMTDYSHTEPIGATKSFKIDDPVEAARSSIWTHHTSTITSTVDTLIVFQPKPSQTKTEDPSTQSCHINPAALSRSISFHEIN